VDKVLNDLCNHIRTMHPNSVLTQLSGDSVLCKSGNLDLETLLAFFLCNRDVTFQCVFKVATRQVNDYFLAHLHEQEDPLGYYAVDTGDFGETASWHAGHGHEESEQGSSGGERYGGNHPQAHDDRAGHCPAQQVPHIRSSTQR